MSAITDSVPAQWDEAELCGGKYRADYPNLNTYGDAPSKYNPKPGVPLIKPLAHLEAALHDTLVLRSARFSHVCAASEGF